MASNKVSQSEQSLNLSSLSNMSSVSRMSNMSSMSSLGEMFKSLLDTGTGYQTNSKNVKYEEIKSRCLMSAEKRLKNLEYQKPLKSVWKTQSRSELNTLVCVSKFRGSSYGPDQRTAKRIESQMKIRFRCFPCRKKFNQLAKLLLHRCTFVQTRVG